MTQSEVHSAETYLVNQVARIADVTVRTLHYYEEIGLLVPAARSEAGYRLYDASNLDRLRQIRVGRELGLSLEEIRRSLDEAGFDRRSTLLRQRRQLVETATTTAATIEAIDRALKFVEQGKGRSGRETGGRRVAAQPGSVGDDFINGQTDDGGNWFASGIDRRVVSLIPALSATVRDTSPRSGPVIGGAIT